MFNKTLADRQNEYLVAKEKADLLKERYGNMNDAFLNEQAGVLAETLTQGKPCPVCGSTHHPQPAVKSANAPTKEEIKKAKSDYERALEFADEKSRKAGELNGRVATLKKTAEENTTKMLGKVSLEYASYKAEEEKSKQKIA